MHITSRTTRTVLNSLPAAVRHADSMHSFKSSLKSHYRAMHYNAKRGIAIACRPSVRLSVRLSVPQSVTLVDQEHTRWKSWKLIAGTISPTPCSA